MLIAELKGADFLRRLRSAVLFKDAAICFGSVNEKTPSSSSRALLSFVTFPDHFFIMIPLP
jgi:hypothetical protein